MSSTKRNKLFFLIDCNSFYASCEMVFNPKLRKKPVVVLSNNDGCVIARSKVAKELGIPMGAPAFQYQDLFNKHNVFVYSSNYTLYGDLSSRVMQVLKTFSPEIEIYSIDEAFLYIDTKDPIKLARQIRKTVFRWTGIPVSIGIGETKTLAKAANHWAKKHLSTQGVFQLTPSDQSILTQIPVKDVWGIGSRIGKRLENYQITNIWELTHQSDGWIRKAFSITLLKTVLELRGQVAIALCETAPFAKSVTCSRSFGGPITTLPKLQEAISCYAAQAAAKLRKNHQLARYLHVFLTTSPFIDTPYSNGMTVTFDHPTAYTPTFITKSKECIKQLFLEGYQYKKAGVILTELSSSSCYQQDLFSSFSPKQANAQTSFDHVKKRFGKQAIQFAAEGIKQPWKMVRQHTSKRFTTRWDEILTITS